MTECAKLKCMCPLAGTQEYLESRPYQNFAVMYCFVLVIMQEEKLGSYLHSCVSGVIGLMKLRTKPKDPSKILPRESPTLLTQLLFIDELSNAVYNWTAPRFVSDNQGHSSSVSCNQKGSCANTRDACVNV